MRKLTALVAGMTLAMTALPAAAGVVITQKQHVASGANSRDTEQTISVQGDKQKMVTERRTMIIDLGKGAMFVLDPKAKTYFQMDFPPKGAMATMMAASRDAAMNFKKAGTTRDIAGYKCTDYDGGGHVMQGDYTVKECFSTSAPGRRRVCRVRETNDRQAQERQRQFCQRRGSRWSAARHGRVDENGDGGGEHPGNGAGSGGEDQRDDGETPANRDQPGGREDRVQEAGGERLRDSERLHQERNANGARTGRDENGAACGRIGIAGSALRRRDRLARIDTTGESELKKRAGSLRAPLVFRSNAETIT